VKNPLNRGFFYVQDVLYAAAAWMQESGAASDVYGRNGDIELQQVSITQML